MLPLALTQNRNLEFSALFISSPRKVLTIRQYFFFVIVFVLAESPYVRRTQGWNASNIVFRDILEVGTRDICFGCTVVGFNGLPALFLPGVLLLLLLAERELLPRPLDVFPLADDDEAFDPIEFGFDKQTPLLSTLSSFIVATALPPPQNEDEAEAVDLEDFVSFTNLSSDPSFTLLLCLPLWLFPLYPLELLPLLFRFFLLPDEDDGVLGKDPEAVATFGASIDCGDGEFSRVVPPPPSVPTPISADATPLLVLFSSTIDATATCGVGASTGSSWSTTTGLSSSSCVFRA